MIAIQITQAIKDNNPNLNWVVNASLNEIIRRNKIPSTFNGVLNYSSINNSEMQIDDGWKDFIIPTYNEATQKLGGFILDGNNYTYDVVDLTQQEIDGILEETEENQARDKVDNYKYRGGELIEKTRTKMWRRIHLYPDAPMGLTKQQMAKVERWLSDVYFNLLTGNFRQAKNEVISVIEQRDDVTGDSSLLEAAGMLDTVTWLRGEIEYYFDNKYDL